jgi:antitoxin component YwqK of YwqJK toxin-antitoxin module
MKEIILKIFITLLVLTGIGYTCFIIYKNNKIYICDKDIWCSDDFQTAKFKMTAKEFSGNAEKYNSAGVLIFKGSYKNNLLDGSYITYYDNGQIKETSHYKNGILEGLSQQYYENGQLGFEKEYKDGKLNGVQKQYHENGQIDLEIKYKNEF